MKPSCLLLAAVLSISSSLSAADAIEPYQHDGVADPDYEIPAELDLSYALSFALDNNHAIRQARERIKQQEGVVLEVSSLRLPTVAASDGLSWWLSLVSMTRRRFALRDCMGSMARGGGGGGGGAGRGSDGGCCSGGGVVRWDEEPLPLDDEAAPGVARRARMAGSRAAMRAAMAA